MLHWLKQLAEKNHSSAHLSNNGESNAATSTEQAEEQVSQRADQSDNSSGNQIRRHYVFRGQVQGVGFRWNARTCANELGLLGWIRNEWDGSVTMELQGESESLARFFTLFNQQYRHYPIDYVIDEMEEIAPRDDEEEFKVLFS